MQTIIKFAIVVLVIMMFVGGHYLAMDYINQVENMEYEKAFMNSTNFERSFHNNYSNTSINNHILSEEYFKYSKALIANGSNYKKCNKYYTSSKLV